MDLLTIQDLESVADRRHAEPSVSLFMPTHRFGNDTAADPVHWKNLLSATNDALVSRGVARRDIDKLLAPATSLLDDAMAWQYMSRGLAVHLQSGWHQVSRVPFPLPEIAVIGDQLAVSPLLQATTRGGHFLVLTVSQRRIRLLEATSDTIEEVELAELPADLRDVIEAHEPRSDTMARSLAGGSSGPAVFYGHGAADDDFKTQETIRFLRRVATGLQEALINHDLPMVLVGLDPATKIFRDVSSYPHITDSSVDRNPDQLSADEVLAAAWPVVAARFEQARNGLADRFKELHGTGEASTDPDRIEQAAANGRVEALFVPTNPWVWQNAGTADPTVVDLDADHPDETAQSFGQLERTVVAALTSSGEIVTVDAPTTPGGGQIAAIFRY